MGEATPPPRLPLRVSLGTSKVALTITDDGNNGFSDLTAHWTLANVFPMRLMMQLNGFVENPATMTFNEHDKFRVTWMDSLTRNWMQQTALYGVPNIASIPNTGDMNTSQEPAGTIAKSGYILSSGATSGGKVLITNTSAPYASGAGVAAPHGLVDGDVITVMEKQPVGQRRQPILSPRVHSVGRHSNYFQNHCGR